MALDSDVVKKIIFDLDDTLFDTNGQLVKIAVKEACEAMIAKGLKTNLEDCLKYLDKLISDHAKNRTRGDIFEGLAKHFGTFTELDAVIKAGSDQFHNREIKEEIFLFEEAAEVLNKLKIKYTLYLVTLGGLATQTKKVELLGLKPFFEKIYYVDISFRKTKTAAFKEIMSLPPVLRPPSYLCVGNRVDSEIRDAKSLGMQTVLLSHGEYFNLVPQDSFEEPDHVIRSLNSLLEILK